MATVSGKALMDAVWATARKVGDHYLFEGKNSDEWMREMMRLEQAGEPDRVCNDAHSISTTLACMDDK